MIKGVTKRINNKDAHRFNDSGAPRLGNVWVYGREMVRSEYG